MPLVERVSVVMCVLSDNSLKFSLAAHLCGDAAESEGLRVRANPNSEVPDGPKARDRGVCFRADLDSSGAC